MPIIIPTEPIEASQIDPKLLTIYGAPKIGKTTALAKLEEWLKSIGKKSCILEMDRDGEGADFLTCTRIRIKSYNDVLETCSEIVKMGRPFSHIGFDSVTVFEDLCEQDATEQYKKSNAGKKFEGRSVLELVGPDFNPGYRWLRLSFKLAMGKLLQAAPHVIVIGHIRDKYLKAEEKDKGKTDTETATKELDLSGKIRSDLAGNSDALGFMYRTYSNGATANSIPTQKLNISFKTHDLVQAGTRCPHLVQQAFELEWKLIYPNLNKQQTT